MRRLNNVELTFDDFIAVFVEGALEMGPWTIRDADATMRRKEAQPQVLSSSLHHFRSVWGGGIRRADHP